MASKTVSSKEAPSPRLPKGHYFKASQRPLQSLLFLLPFILIYELGMWYFATHSPDGVARDIYARALLEYFFRIFDITGYYLPGLMVVIVLLTMHFFQKDRSEIPTRTSTCLWMGAECLALAFPLFIFAMVLAKANLAMALQVPATELHWSAQLVYSFGAGIYEELLFRLILIVILHMVLVDGLSLPKKPTNMLIVLISGLVFSLYHFSDSNPFDWFKFTFYTGAGVYFALIYVVRGFGIVAGTHALYDVLVVLLKMM